MKKRTVIKASSLPTRSPVGAAILFWLLLDRLGAPGWAYGVLWTVAAFAILGFTYRFWTDAERDVPGFGDK